MVAHQVDPALPLGDASAAGQGKVQKLSELDLGELPRIPTNASELDRVLGGRWC